MPAKDHSLFHHLSAQPKDGAPECLLYTDQSSPRLLYTCHFVFSTVLSSSFRLTHSTDEFEAYTGAKVNYSGKQLNSGLHILPSGLLFEKGVNEKQPELLPRGNLMKAYVYSAAPTQEHVGYDLFSMVFFFVSRYEEWQNYEADEHGRFGIRQSVLFRFRQHRRPLVDLCIMEFKDKLSAKFPFLAWPNREARVISTVDVDNLFAFKGRPLWKIVAGSCRDLIKGDVKNLLTRFRVLSGKEPDPFDVYNEWPVFCKQESFPLLFFFLYRNGTTYDRGVRPGHAAFLKVFQRLKSFPVHIGIHPSYFSQTKGQFEDELNQLRRDLELDVVYSRQHYLRFDIRTSPGRWMKAGIRADFSMGFSDEPAFRAGTSFPFPYYNFEREQSEDLVFVPFCMMDGAYSVHRPQAKQNILNELLAMGSDIKSSGGNFITVFHERSFYNHLYPGFGPLYKEMHLQLKALFRT